MIDPLGFALENFDAVGRWRDVDETFDADRRVGRAARRHEVRRARRASATALLQQPERFVSDGDREAADLRARPRRRVLRHAGGPAHRPRAAADYKLSESSSGS